MKPDREAERLAALDEYVRQLVAAAPPLTEEQRRKIRPLLRKPRAARR